MTIIQKFKKGLSISSKSFSLIWNHKKLLVYLGIPVLLGTLAEILAYNIQPDSASICACFSQKDAIARILRLGTSHSFFHYILIIFVSFFYLAIVTFQSIALTNHTYTICKKEKKGIKEIIKSCIPKIKTAIIWTIFTLIPIVTFHMINAQIEKNNSIFSQLFYAIIIFAIFTIWSLITAFVIQTITIENANIKLAIKKSISAIKKLFFQYLGVIFWIGLIALLSATPFLILERFINTIYILSIPLILIIYCVISSAYVISKTLLYLEFKK